jgi:ring-1,2-phenylacetyl-CoA epoxidase subunit PaaE
MLNNTVLSESEIEDGLILACQAVAISDELDIDFDDV